MNDNNTLIQEPEKKPTKEPAAARWRKLIEQQGDSGLGVSAYCRERGLSATSMFAWKRRLRPAGERPVVQMYKPVTVVPEALGRSTEQPEPSDLAPIELRLCSGCCGGRSPERHLIVRRGFDRQLLIDLVQALESLA